MARRSREDILRVTALCSKGFKKCTLCTKLKSVSKFTTNLRGLCGLHNRCNACRREFAKSQPSTELRGVQGLSKALLLRRYTGCCEICGVKAFASHKVSLSIDHDHHTNKVRGLLCHNCNLMLGHAKDNPLILELTIKYLEKYRND